MRNRCEMHTHSMSHHVKKYAVHEGLHDLMAGAEEVTVVIDCFLVTDNTANRNKKTWNISTRVLMYNCFSSLSGMSALLTCFSSDSRMQTSFSNG